MTSSRPAIARVHARSVEGPVVHAELGPCLDCTLVTNERGYPIVHVGRRTTRAARIVLAHALGRAIRPGLGALHRCDRRTCVREHHVYEGSQRDNMRDMRLRGRHRGAPANNRRRARLNELAVRVIRWLAARGTPRWRLAAAHGVSVAAVDHAISGRSWKD